MASWYGPNFHGKKTANGEIFNTFSLTAAHKTLPLNSIVKVVSLENNKTVIVRINDRGPFKSGRIIDLSKAAASRIGVLAKGTMNVKIVVLKEGDNKYYKYNPVVKYKIQIASFGKMERAEELITRLSAADCGAVMEHAVINGENFYRVVIPSLSYSLLQSYKMKLHRSGVDRYLVRVDRG